MLKIADRAGSGDDKLDLRSPRDCENAVKDVSAIIHLAGAAKETDAATLREDNVTGLTNLLTSAVWAGVSHFVFASTMHVMGMYRRDERFDESSAPRPDSLYAASKVHCEALCQVFALKAPIAITCLRLGSVTKTLAEADPGLWISPRDVMALVRIGLTMPVPSYEVFHAVADYKGSPWKAGRAHSYGYKCAYPAGHYRDALKVARSWWQNKPLARDYCGATFASDPLILEPAETP